MLPGNKCILYVANTSWYLFNFRLPLMKSMVECGWRVVAAAPLDRYSGRFAEHGITYHPMDMSRKGLNPFSDMRLLHKLYDLYRKERPALVHHFTIKPVIYGSLAARFARVPAVVNAVTGLGHVYAARGLKARVLKAVVNTIYRPALRGRNVRVIFQNPDDREAFIARGLLRPERAVLIRGSGVDVSSFVPAPEPKGEPVILLCARMLRNKGVEDLIAAARLLNKRRISCRVVLAGDSDQGNPEAIPVTQLQEWDREGIIAWLGHREDMPAVFANAHIVALPTTYGEGVPRSLIEAAACGRPIVANDVAGCREIVRHGENGFLVPAGDGKALADALGILIEDSSLRIAMGIRGREIAVAEFAQELVLDATHKVYNELLNNSLARTVE